jgi:small subunit ribosomal protein S17
MDSIQKIQRKHKQGTVISNKMQKTVVVEVIDAIPHPVYSKIVKRSKKYYAHTDQQLNVGDTVVIVETRPLSKLKRWRVEKQDNE